MNAEESSPRGRLLGVAGLLAVLAFVLYARTRGFAFLNYDDPDYVSANPFVARGLSLEGVRWAFGFHAANWHPLTWLSHMLDVQLFGLAPGPMHLVNAGLHALNGALLFLALAALTLRFWPSLLVAALFLAHPLRVQSVAWISERKDLLAGFFFCALLLAYARYARSGSRRAYGSALACLALGLMAKPMLVTAPFVLCLLDVWPLGAQGAGRRRVWLDKLPFFALAAVSALLTWLAQRSGGAVAELGALSFSERLWTAGAGVLAYVRATLWPSGLAAFYPHPLLVGGQVLVPGLIGLGLTLGLALLAWRARRCCAALFSGWFWFLGMLVPVLGLVQVGDQAWADRYAYLPTVGLTIALVFGLAEGLRGRAQLQSALLLAGLSAAGLLAFVSARTLPHWQDSHALWQRALAVTEKNWIAENNLGLVYLERRETARARTHFEAAARIRPSFVPARYNLGRCLEADGEFEQAIQVYQATLQAHPGHGETLLRLAALARAGGQAAQALEFFEQAIQQAPNDPRVWGAYARALLEQGDVNRAANCAESALRLDPSHADAYLILAEIALKRGEIDEADARLARALALAPSSAEVHALRGRLLATRQDAPGARAAFERSIQLDPGSARARYDLGGLLLATGERDAARAQFQAVNDIRPGDPQALIALAVIALEDQKPQESIQLLQTALQRLPGFPLALNNLAAAYEQIGDWAKALETYEKSFAAAPADPDAACAAAWIYATGPDEALLKGERAVELALYAAQRQAANALEVLAAAYARAGDFGQALTTQEQAAQRERNPERKRQLEQRLELFRAGKPYLRPR